MKEITDPKETITDSSNTSTSSKGQDTCIQDLHNNHLATESQNGTAKLPDSKSEILIRKNKQ